MLVIKAKMLLHLSQQVADWPLVTEPESKLKLPLALILQDEMDGTGIRRWRRGGGTKSFSNQKVSAVVKVKAERCEPIGSACNRGWSDKPALADKTGQDRVGAFEVGHQELAVWGGGNLGGRGHAKGRWVDDDFGLSRQAPSMVHPLIVPPPPAVRAQSEVPDAARLAGKLPPDQQRPPHSKLSPKMR